jgi:hypothetical protein
MHHKLEQENSAWCSAPGCGCSGAQLRGSSATEPGAVRQSEDRGDGAFPSRGMVKRIRGSGCMDGTWRTAAGAAGSRSGRPRGRRQNNTVSRMGMLARGVRWATTR